MARDLTLSIDVGTGSVRAALVDRRRRDPPHRRRASTIRSCRNSAGPSSGRSDWWAGVVRTDPRRARRGRGRAPSASPRLRLRPDARHRAGRRGRPADARHRAAVERQAHRRRSSPPSSASTPPRAYLAESGNPPTPAWPGFKLAWLRDNDPRGLSARPATVLMPKDYINLRLTGETRHGLRRRVLQLPDEPARAPLVARR